MTSSQTVRAAARELIHDAAEPFDPDIVSDVEMERFFDIMDRITNDRRFANTRHKRQLIENIAVRMEQDTALEEFVSWFASEPPCTGPCCS